MTKVTIHSSISTMKSTQLTEDHQKESNKRRFPESAGIFYVLFNQIRSENQVYAIFPYSIFFN